MKLLKILVLGCLLTALALPAAAGPFEDARAAHRQKRYEDAIRLFTVDINSGTNTPYNLAVVYNNRGNTYLVMGKLDKALADFNRALELNPKHANAFYNRSIVYERQGKRDLAIADVERFVKLKPDDPDGPRRLALLRRAKATPPSQGGDAKPATFYNDRGWKRYKAGKLTQALADYNRAIKKDPSFALAYNNRGIVYRHLKKYDLAMADYRKVLELANDTRAAAFAYFNLALLHELRGDYATAIREVKQFIKREPNDPDGPRLLARLQKKAGSAKPAGPGPAPTTQVTTPPPTTTGLPSTSLSARDITRAGWTLYRQGKFNEAIAKYNLAIKKDPKFALAYHNRGLAFRKKGMYDRAVADYTRVIQLKPDVDVVYYNRSLAYELKGDYQKALADIDTYIKRVPKDPDGPAAKRRIQKKMAAPKK